MKIFINNIQQITRGSSRNPIKRISCSWQQTS